MLEFGVLWLRNGAVATVLQLGSLKRHVLLSFFFVER